MRILVTGSRFLSDAGTVNDALLGLWLELGQPDDAVLVCGGARGADTLAAAVWQKALGLPVEEHPADWQRHGPAASPLRNTEMVTAGADVCLAFFQDGAINAGTRDTVNRCAAAGIPVREFHCAIAANGAA